MPRKYKYLIFPEAKALIQEKFGLQDSDFGISIDTTVKTLIKERFADVDSFFKACQPSLSDITQGTFYSRLYSCEEKAFRAAVDVLAKTPVIKKSAEVSTTTSAPKNKQVAPGTQVDPVRAQYVEYGKRPDGGTRSEDMAEIQRRIEEARADRARGITRSPKDERLVQIPPLGRGVGKKKPPGGPTK